MTVQLSYCDSDTEHEIYTTRTSCKCHAAVLNNTYVSFPKFLTYTKSIITSYEVS